MPRADAPKTARYTRPNCDGEESRSRDGADLKLEKRESDQPRGSDHLGSESAFQRSEKQPASGPGQKVPGFRSCGKSRVPRPDPDENRGSHSPKSLETRKSDNSPQTERNGTPNGDSESARHSENSEREKRRGFPSLEAQKSLTVRRRSNGEKSEPNQSLTNPEPEIDSFSPDQSTGGKVTQRGKARYLPTGTE